MFGGKSSTPPTPTRGIPVVLGDGRERHLRYSLASLQEIDKTLGPQMSTGTVKGDHIATLLWFGLRWEDPELTPEQVGDLVDLENLETVVEAMGKALGNKAKVKFLDPTPPAPTPSPDTTPA